MMVAPRDACMLFRLPLPSEVDLLRGRIYRINQPMGCLQRPLDVDAVWPDGELACRRKVSTTPEPPRCFRGVDTRLLAKPPLRSAFTQRVFVEVRHYVAGTYDVWNCLLKRHARSLKGGVDLGTNLRSDRLALHLGGVEQLPQHHNEQPRVDLAMWVTARLDPMGTQVERPQNPLPFRYRDRVRIMCW